MTLADIKEMERYVPNEVANWGPWCRLHACHLMAYAVGNYGAAAAIADAKYDIWLRDQHEMTARVIRIMTSEEEE